MIKGQTRFLVLLFDRSLILFFQFSDVSLKYSNLFPVGNFIFKVDNRNIRAKCEICSKSAIRTPKRPNCRRFDVFIVNFEHISNAR